MKKDDRKTRVNNISLKEAREIIGKSNVKEKKDKLSNLELESMREKTNMQYSTSTNLKAVHWKSLFN